MPWRNSASRWTGDATQRRRNQGEVGGRTIVSVGRSTYMRLFCFEFRVACSEYSEIESPLVAWDDRWNAMIELYQFPFSHYCEKVRWALDYKCITYLTINLLPGLHFRRLAKFVPKSSVPVLRDGKTVVQDSSAIIDYLDVRNANPALTPPEPKAAREALDWEEYFDEQIGANLRLWFYYHTLPECRIALSFLLQGVAWQHSPVDVGLQCSKRPSRSVRTAGGIFLSVSSGIAFAVRLVFSSMGPLWEFSLEASAHSSPETNQ